MKGTNIVCEAGLGGRTEVRAVGDSWWGVCLWEFQFELIMGPKTVPRMTHLEKYAYIVLDRYRKGRDVG